MSASSIAPGQPVSTGQPALSALQITKVFPGVTALDRASLTLRPGSIHALLGENGAGKSTLIKVLTGVHRADGGRFEVGGAVASFGSPQEAAAAGIGVVHQERNVVGEFTVAENICLQDPPRHRGVVDLAEMERVARRCLTQLDVDLDPQARVADLSVAQVQLVEIARALSRDSRILLLDEPTASITPDEAARLFTVLRHLTEAGTALLFVSHKLEEVFSVCDTVTVLRDGRSVLEGAPLADYDRDGIVDLMVGRAHSAVTLAPREVDPDGAPRLELRGLATSAGHRNVNLSVRSGEIVGLYGLVGAGRTELATSVLGLHRVTGGQILVAGEPVTIPDVAVALHRHGIGYVPEDRKGQGVFLEQPITRNIAVTVWSRIAQRLTGRVSAGAERDIVRRMVSDLDIRLAALDQTAGTLSGGNQQKVSLAKWLAAEARILMIDEPTVGIDVRTKAMFHELIWDLARQGMAVLLISSDLPEMVTLADRVLVMRDFAVKGELVNDHDYEAMSGRVIRLIHAPVNGAAARPAEPEESRRTE